MKKNYNKWRMIKLNRFKKLKKKLNYKYNKQMKKPKKKLSWNNKNHRIKFKK